MVSSNYQTTLGHPMPRGLRACITPPFVDVWEIPNQIQAEQGRDSLLCAGFSAKRDANWMRKPNTTTTDVPEHPPSVLERTP